MYRDADRRRRSWSRIGDRRRPLRGLGHLLVAASAWLRPWTDGGRWENGALPQMSEKMKFLIPVRLLLSNYFIFNLVT